MKKLQALLILIGVVQLVLGALFLFAPQMIMSMLAARFIALGIGMFWCARAPEQNLFWINNMILIQVIDLAVGIYYTTTGVVALSSSAFPMFNATLFIILLCLWRPQPTNAMVAKSA